MQATSRPQGKGYRGLPMEGMVARWYSGLRGTESQVEAYRKQAAQLTAGLREGAAILEVAPAPAYFTIELARLGRFRVTALDISRTFVDIATENARQQGVSVDFRHGNASDMPFDEGSFDLIVCQAAFKNFAHPVVALDEMHRVLRPGGAAVIQDMSKGASAADIDHEVSGMRVSRVSAFMTRVTLKRLRRRAYTVDQFRALAASSAFGSSNIQASGIGLEVRLRKG